MLRYQFAFVLLVLLAVTVRSLPVDQGISEEQEDSLNYVENKLNKGLQQEIPQSIESEETKEESVETKEIDQPDSNETSEEQQDSTNLRKKNESPESDEDSKETDPQQSNETEENNKSLESSEEAILEKELMPVDPQRVLAKRNALDIPDEDLYSVKYGGYAPESTTGHGSHDEYLEWRAQESRHRRFVDYDNAELDKDSKDDETQSDAHNETDEVDDVEKDEVDEAEKDEVDDADSDDNNEHAHEDEEEEDDDDSLAN